MQVTREINILSYDSYTLHQEGTSSRLTESSRPNQISIVLATWCPHCVPLSLEMTKKMSEDLAIPYRVLDIDGKESGPLADRLVKTCGDNSEDYIVPQVFLEYANGTVRHVFTGFSEATDATRKHWNDFFESSFYSTLRRKA